MEKELAFKNEEISSLKVNLLRTQRKNESLLNDLHKSNTDVNFYLKVDSSNKNPI